MRRLLTVATLLLALLVAGAAATGLWLARSGLPQRQGSAVLAGLSDAVTVRYDDWGVPHIAAADILDAAQALGWVHANDRMVQLELGRRRAAGRLAEVIGEAGIASDRHFRALGFPRMAAALAAAAGDESRALLEAYARGINGWLRQRDGDLPTELRLLRLRPEPWSPMDSLYFHLQMAHELSFWDGRPEETRFGLLGTQGLERTLDLLGVDELHVPPGLVEIAAERMAGRRAPTDRPLPPGLDGATSPGSNNWALGASRTDDGTPLLASDPHLPLFMPGFWYQATLRSPGYEVAGLTLPGLPFVVIGQGPAVAWGLTNVMLDDHDLFFEELNADGSAVRRAGGWEPLRHHEERIEVAGGETETLVVRTTDRGVLLEANRESGLPARSLAWSATAPLDAAATFLRIARAPGVDALVGDLEDYAGPAQNLVAVDRDGGLLHAAIGRVPLRRRGDGGLPSLGWDDAYGWDGLLPQAANPLVLDPPDDLLVTANNDIRPFGWLPPAVPFTASFDTSHRADRIRQLLESRERWSSRGLSGVQTDVVSRWATQLIALLEREYRGASAYAYETLVQWDAGMQLEGAAALFAVVERELWDGIFGDETTRAAFSHMARRRQLLRVLSGAMSETWFDDAATGRTESAAEVVSAALARSWDEIVARFGDDPGRWDYGSMHLLTLEHPLGALPIVGRMLGRGPLRAPGSQTTVAAFGAAWDGPIKRVAYGPSMRWIADPANPDRSLVVLPTGQAGHPWDAHYGDQTTLYMSGQLREAHWSEAKIAANTVSTVELLPASAR